MIRSTQLLAVLAVLSASFSACSKPPVTVETYDKDGVRFSHFSDWKIDKDEPIAGAPGTRIIHVEGPDNALVSLLWLPVASAVTVESFAASVAEGRAQAVEKKVGDFKALQESGGASEPATAKIAGREVRGVRQTFDVVLLGNHVPHEASFYMLQTDTHKVMIMAQVSRESLEATRPAWQKVFDTLSLAGQAGF
jgi:hypothetical protein